MFTNWTSHHDKNVSFAYTWNYLHNDQLLTNRTEGFLQVSTHTQNHYVLNQHSSLKQLKKFYSLRRNYKSQQL